MFAAIYIERWKLYRERERGLGIKRVGETDTKKGTECV